MPNTKEDVQPDETDVQPSEGQENDAQPYGETDDFDPKKGTKEYVKKWRDASAEAAKYRKELQALKAEKERKEKATLKEQGKYKEMYDALQGEHQSLKGVLENAARSTAFKQEYLKAGGKPHLAEAAERLIQIQEIELDEKFRPNREQVVFEVDKFKEKFGADFFQKDVKPPKDGPPKKGESKQPDLVSEAKKAKTQQELDAVLKKFGVI